MATETSTETTEATILVVDDDPETGRLVRSWFDGRPFKILEARDGERGLALIAARRPDLVLLDMKMPGLDGVEVARRLRADPALRSTPVIFLSACRDVETKVTAFSVGAHDYVTKPFACEEVEARIRIILGRHRAMAGMESRVEHLQSENRGLENLLALDEKTGLCNFREFQRRLRDEWERAARYGAPLSLVFMDIDHFKRVNDTLGHPAGDAVLREFATLVTGGARSNDVAARYGGEEFAIILPHTDGAMAEIVAERIRRAVREFPFSADGQPTRITVSAGVATFPSTPEIDSMDALIRAADRALYAAKDAGRDRVVR